MQRANRLAIILALVMLVVFSILPYSLSVEENSASADPSVAQTPDKEFTLVTIVGGTPAMAFQGVGGDIDGVMNPDLMVEVGDVVQITVINGAPILHDLRIDEFDVYTGELTEKDQESVVTFVATEAGTFAYYCSIPGHRPAGMVGNIIVVDSGQPAEAEDVTIISRHPSDVPSPLEDREPQTLQIDLETVEVEARLANGATMTYWTFDGQVPGPMIRARVGDTIEMSITNREDSLHVHSIDLHSVTGPGGGAIYTQTDPGETTSFSFQVLKPGLYVYHCATPSVATHISNGMYGMILVEPEGGLSEVDHEFYVMQGEIYTEQPVNSTGYQDFSYDNLLNEDPTYFVFNGAANALTTDELAMYASTGDTVRIYFGVGGPNFTSSFHVIGEIFDTVYDLASITSDPLQDVQTTLVPPGGATIVEFSVEVPGRYILVDHALSRLERGLVGFLYVDGDPRPEIFDTMQDSEEFINSETE